MLAGIAVGPFTPGFVADVHLAPELAEIGVILLMFGVGMHFSIQDLWAVRKIALPGALAQILVATALGAVLALSWGWSLGAGLVFGLALSVASTVVLLRALQAGGILTSQDGQIAVGWLVVEDLVTVVTLVLLPALAGGRAGGTAPTAGELALTLGWTALQIGIFVALMLVVGTRVFPWLLARVERTGSSELFTLAVIALALGVGYGSAESFGISFALGAFFAGVVINGSDSSRRAAHDLESIQSAFGVLFFVAVGMLFDPAILIREPLRVLAVLAIILLGKSFTAIALTRALGYSTGTALTVGAALAQIGEFSFILAGLGVTLGLLPSEGNSLVLAGALLSITLNPLAFRLVARLKRAPVAAPSA